MEIIILTQLLNGHIDIAKYIILLKKQIEMNDAQQFWIDTNYYNWLLWDIPIRSQLGIIEKHYCELSPINKHNFVSNIYHVDIHNISIFDWYDYYDKHKELLGLDNTYIRTNSLLNCYQSKWWKTTEKHSLSWNSIHKIITNQFIIKIYYRKYKPYLDNYEYIFNDLLHETMYFRNPSLKEKYKILDMYVNTRDNSYDQDFSRGYILTDSKLTII